MSKSTCKPTTPKATPKATKPKVNAPATVASIAPIITVAKPAITASKLVAAIAQATKDHLKIGRVFIQLGIESGYEMQSDGSYIDTGLPNLTSYEAACKQAYKDFKNNEKQVASKSGAEESTKQPGQYKILQSISNAKSVVKNAIGNGHSLGTVDNMAVPNDLKNANTKSIADAAALAEGDSTDNSEAQAALEADTKALAYAEMRAMIIKISATIDEMEVDGAIDSVIADLHCELLDITGCKQKEITEAALQAA
jgi:hypothetical protein